MRIIRNLWITLIPVVLWFYFAVFALSALVSPILKYSVREEETDFYDIQIPGDIVLGGLFPIHEDGSPVAVGRHCGAIKPDKGIQRMEAMLFALDAINSNGTLLPTLKLGAHILDTCNQDTHGLEQTLKFIKNSLSQENMEFYQCPDSRGVINKAPKPVAAVIGAASSQVSSMVANVLRLFKIPQISYSSTAPELSDKNRFEYFTRVVPPDTLQAQAMADVVEKLGWRYVSAVFDEGSYGEQGYEAFYNHAKNKDICVATAQKLRRDFKDDNFTNVVKELHLHNLARGIVLFVNEDNVKRLLKAVHNYKTNMKTENHFAWVASDNWGNKRSAVQDYQVPAVGAITIRPKVSANEAFNDYFVKLNPKNHSHPYKWFDLFWKHQFNCTQLDEACLSNSLAENHQQESYVPFVVDAVFLAAHALSRLLHDNCGVLPFNVCLGLNTFRIEGSQLLQYIRNTSFFGMQNEEVRLNQNGDRMILYEIYQYRGFNNHYDYVNVGEWVSKKMSKTGRVSSALSNASELTLNMSMIRTGYLTGVLPESVCQHKCGPNHYKSSSSHNKCCWECLFCNESKVQNETSCTPCEEGLKPNYNKSECIPIIPEILAWNSPYALVPACVSAIGIVATTFVVTVFVKHNKTPIIMASGRELCYIMLCGILFCYSMTFPLLNPPTPALCGVLRVGLGLCLCIIYAAILTKTSRLSRIFTSNVRSMQRPRFISPRAQAAICCAMVSVQLIGSAIWIIVDPPNVERKFSLDRMKMHMSCKVTAQPMLLSLSYIALLIAACTIYAFKTRKIPENFNETKHIGFTMYATCIIWLAFVPIYFGTNDNFKVQIISLCMCLSLSGTVALCCFFAPKLYIVLFQPEKNVRSHTSMTGFQKMQMSMVQQQMRFLSRPTATAPAPTSTLGSQNPETMNTTSLISMKSTESINGDVQADELRSKSDRSSSAMAKRSDSKSAGKSSVTVAPNAAIRGKENKTVPSKQQHVVSNNDIIVDSNKMTSSSSPTETTPFLYGNSAKEETVSLLGNGADAKSRRSSRDVSPDSYTEPVRLRNRLHPQQQQQQQRNLDWILVDPQSEFASIISDISTQKGTFV